MKNILKVPLVNFPNKIILNIIKAKTQNNWELSLEPRKWQITALEEWNKELKGIVSVVTGGGKTLFAFFCMLEFKKKYKEGKIIIIVPTITLLDQWYIGLLDDLSIPAAEIACFSSEEKPKKFLRVNLMVINTARTVLKK